MKDRTMNIRIGEGWDTHALVEGRPLILGGVHIPFAKGLLGHSTEQTTASVYRRNKGNTVGPLK